MPGLPPNVRPPIVYVSEDVEFNVCDVGILVTVVGTTYCISPHRLKRAIRSAETTFQTVIMDGTNVEAIKKG